MPRTARLPLPAPPPRGRLPPRWPRPPASLLHRTGPSMGIPMTVPITEQIRLLREFRPTSLLVYPSNLIGILDQLARDGATLEGIGDIRTIGEILTPETRARARAELG